MSEFLSRLDKTTTNAYYEVEIDMKTGLPRTVRVSVLTGRKGETRAARRKIVGGRHVAFHFEYRLSRFGGPKEADIPAAALRLLGK